LRARADGIVGCRKRHRAFERLSLERGIAVNEEHPIWFELPPRSTITPVAPQAVARPVVALSLDGEDVRVPDGATILDACREVGKDVPTLCYLETLTPVNACRICVVELEGARVLAPACSRKAEAGMKIQTNSPRVRTARKVVLELLASSVDLSTADELRETMREYGADPARFGLRDRIATVSQPVKIDNDLYIRDYSKCVLCYKCVEACGADAQNTFAIAVAGRGFHAHISTELDVPLPESACVYCGNCIAVCPTGALMAKPEFDLRQAGEWAPERQETTDTICPYCGVGCTLSVHVQDERIIKVMSPFDNEVTHGNLCVKGRFGFEYVHHENTK
jgi:predicted molibdopterin-dependent oxidoreductase YjgC